MTDSTDPRVEAAARVIQIAMDGVNTAFFEYVSADALKAADEAAWRPIEGVKDCPLAALIEQGSDEGPYIGSCRDGVWCDGLDMVEPTHTCHFLRRQRSRHDADYKRAGHRAPATRCNGLDLSSGCQPASVRSSGERGNCKPERAGIPDETGSRK